MLNIFRGKRDAPQYTLAPPAGGQLEHLTAHQEVSGGTLGALKPHCSSKIDVKNKALRFRGHSTQH